MQKRILSILLATGMLWIGNTSISNASESTEILLKYQMVSVTRGGKTSNSLINATGKVSWKSSNKRIATVTSKGIIKGKRLGKCTITAKYKGQSYRCRVAVMRAKPDFDAKIVYVAAKKGKTRVKVYFSNNSGRTLTIFKKATYNDYTDVDYAVKQKRQIKIKSHQKKTVTFINYGRYEIWNHAGRQDPDIFAEALESKIFYKFKFDGKVYKGKTFWYYVEDEYGQWIDKYKSTYGKGIQTLAKRR